MEVIVIDCDEEYEGAVDMDLQQAIARSLGHSREPERAEGEAGERMQDFL